MYKKTKSSQKIKITLNKNIVNDFNSFYTFDITAPHFLLQKRIFKTTQDVTVRKHKCSMVSSKYYLGYRFLYLFGNAVIVTNKICVYNKFK